MADVDSTLSGKTSSLMERWFYQDARGRRYVAPPWDDLRDDERERLPVTIWRRTRINRWLLGCSFALCAWGLADGGRALLAFGCGLFWVVLAAYLEARRACGSWEIRELTLPERVAGTAELPFSFTLSNESNKTLGPLLVHFLFDGAAQPEIYLIELPLKPQEKRRVVVPLKAEVGMGKFHVGNLRVAVRDPLGLYTLCLACPFEAETEVIPEVEPLAAFEVETRGLSMHSGPFETARPGHSSSVLGIRNWRSGDSIRHVDWKRSQRQGDLLVREFERMAATEATFFFDQGSIGHCAFKDVSSLQAMREATLALSHCLLAQQISVQLIAEDRHLGHGVGAAQGDLLTELVSGLDTRHDADFMALVARQLPLIQPSSLVALFLCTGNVAFDGLWESLLALDDRGVETVLIVFDSKSYEQQVRKKAQLDGVEKARTDFFLAHLPLDGRLTANGALEGLLQRLSHHIYVVGPGQSLADVCRV